MTIGMRLLVLVVAIAANAAALAAAHVSLAQIAAREQLAQHEPARIVVTGARYGHSLLAIQNCPSPGVL